METYTLLREFADSWMMLFLFAFFVGVVLWVLMGRSKSYRDTAEMIFRHEDKPPSDEEADSEGGSASGQRGKETRI